VPGPTLQLGQYKADIAQFQVEDSGVVAVGKLEVDHGLSIGGDGCAKDERKYLFGILVSHRSRQYRVGWWHRAPRCFRAWLDAGGAITTSAATAGYQ
jgi:hypothetical protein